MNQIVNIGQMIQHDVIQGTPPWHALRGTKLCASYAPVIMGCSPVLTRDKLVESAATQSPIEFSRFTEEVVFKKGHETEAKARPLVEAMLDQDLYTVTGTNGKYLASYDGLVMSNTISFEHKQWNAELALLISEGMPPAYIVWQLEHQLMVCPMLEKVIFVVSDGTADKFVHMEYYAVPGRREELIAAWDQFERDVERYEAPIRTVEAVGTKPADLPVLFVDIAGTLSTTSNLDAFKEGARKLIAGIKTELKTDDDFADADVTVKFLDESEKRIVLVKQQALSKTAQLNDLFTALDEVSAGLKQTRLKLSKQVEAQKANRKTEIVKDATVEINGLIQQACNEFAQDRVQINGIKYDFYGVIKGKRSFDMMQSAVNDELARAKIQLNGIRDQVRANLATLMQDAPDHQFLFPNKQELAFMDPAFLKLTIKSKVDDYEKEQIRLETLRVNNHKQTILLIEGAGEFDDSMPYESLVIARKRVETTETSKLQEFALQGDQAKAKSIAALTARINTLREIAEKEEADKLEREKVARAAAVKVEPVLDVPVEDVHPAADDLIADLDDFTIHAGEQIVSPAPEYMVCSRTEPARPTDRQIIDALTLHFRVHDSVVLGWLMEMDMEEASNELMKEF